MLPKIKRMLLVASVLGVFFTGAATAADLVSHDFDDGSVSPFNVCTTQNPNYAKVVSSRLKTWWTEVGYNGTRMDKGAEICSASWHTRKEGWYGMTMTLGADYPTDKKAGVAQIFQFYSDSFWTWASMLQIDNGDLTVIHRSNGGSSSNVEEVVVADFPKEQAVDIVIHFILSNENAGELQIWVDGVSRYHKQNINFGFSTAWDNDIQTGENSYVDLKAGQYNFQDDDYTSGETRTVYYDNLAWYNGSNGFDLVNPGAGEVQQQSAYTSHSIPGIIEAEDYDNGGAGVAFHDTTSGNSGSDYRADAVDIQQTDDSAGHYNIGWTADGEWLAYTVGSVAAGNYDIHLRVASNNSNSKALNLTLNGVSLGSVSIGDTGGWQEWQTLTLSNVSLGAGDDQILRLGIDGGNFNLNSIEFVALAPVTSNLALNKSVTQSSTGYSSPAELAVDGDTNGKWGDGSVTHTNNEFQAWWQVDLGAVADIDTVNIWNRSDCCSSRLSNYYVFISDEPFVSQDLNETLNQARVESVQLNATASSPTSVDVYRSGRYIRVQLAGTNPLSLAEVEVFGVMQSVTASASADDGNVAAHVLDYDPNLETRWSANGSGQWLQLDLAVSQPVSGVDIAFYKGDQRRANFDIQVSDNGSDWTTVLSSVSSSGSTLLAESFAFNTVSARYVRYVGYGNSDNAWNSLTAFSVRD